MSKQWVKVKELSRDLGVTSHAIIDRCRSAGHTVQNSVSRLAPEVEREVRYWFDETEGSAKQPPLETGQTSGTSKPS